MTRQQAEKEARKRWGRKAMIRAGSAISSPEKRAEAKQRLQANKERRDAIDREVAERLKAMDWYQALMVERKSCLDAIRDSSGWNVYYKFSVGRDVGIAFAVDGRGDTWEEAFARADGKVLA